MILGGGGGGSSGSGSGSKSSGSSGNTWSATGGTNPSVYYYNANVVAQEAAAAAQQQQQKTTVLRTAPVVTTTIPQPSTVNYNRLAPQPIVQSTILENAPITGAKPGSYFTIAQQVPQNPASSWSATAPNRSSMMPGSSILPPTSALTSKTSISGAGSFLDSIMPVANADYAFTGKTQTFGGVVYAQDSNGQWVSMAGYSGPSGYNTSWKAVPQSTPGSDISYNPVGFSSTSSHGGRDMPWMS